MRAYHENFSFDAFSHKKAVLQRSFAGDLAATYLPYTTKKIKLLKALLKGYITVSVVLRVRRPLVEHVPQRGREDEYISLHSVASRTSVPRSEAALQAILSTSDTSPPRLRGPMITLGGVAMNRKISISRDVKMWRKILFSSGKSMIE